MLRAPFLVALEVEEALQVAERDDVADLRAQPEHPRLEAADLVAGAAVAADLLIGVADQADKTLLADELRRAPVEVHVDALVILRVHVLEIVGEAEHGRKLAAGLRIEVGIGAAGIDRVV